MDSQTQITSGAASVNRAGILARYVLGICALLVTSYSLFAIFQAFFFLIVVTVPVALSLFPLLIGEFLSWRNHPILSSFFRTFGAAATFAFAFLLSGVLVLFAYDNPFATLLQTFFYAPLFAFDAIALHQFATKISKTVSDAQPLAMSLTKVSGALGLLFMYALVAPVPSVSWAGYPFLYSGVVYGALSLGPIIASSKRTESYREVGLYLMHTTGQWSTVAFLVGFAAGLLTLTLGNIFGYIAVLIMVGFGVSLVGYKIYSLDTRRLDSIQQEIYKKHEHELRLVSGEDFAYLGRTAREFVYSGRKGHLLVALTTLLANAGVEYSASRLLLESLINYEIPPIYKYSEAPMKKALEDQIIVRMNIVNTTIASMLDMVSKKD
jgi:hypothetical protein